MAMDELVTCFLPQLALCNASTASFVRTNMALTLDGSGGSHVASGFREVKARLEAAYGCLRIT